MKTNIKYIVFTVFMFYAGVVTAQQNPKKRAIQAQGIEQEIQEFIAANRGNYDLTPERINSLTQHITKSKQDKVSLEQMLNRAKDLELRKLYFKENPDAMGAYQIKSLEEIRYICDNGDIEDGYTDDYEFETDQITGVVYGCDNIYSLVSIIPSTTVNDFTEPVTLVNDDTGISGGFDPTLNSLSVNVPRVNSGTTAVKLNNDEGNNGVTKMSKTFIVNSEVVSFSYSFIAKYKQNDDNSYFTAKLYRTSDNALIEEFCLEADADNTAYFSNVLDSFGSTFAYTGWQCHKLSLEGIDFGTEARLEFTVTDDESSSYYGTVYIDDICDNGGGCEPRYGGVELDIDYVNCRKLPVQICGSYQLPYTYNTYPVLYGTLNSISINVYSPSGTLVTTLTTPLYVSATGFCFEILETDLGTPLETSYEFEAVASFILDSYPYTITDTSSNFGPDLDFTECYDDCPDNLIITTDVTSPTNDSQEADFTITASNTIESGATAIYHAEDEVLLIEDFDCLEGATGRFYLEGCTHDYQARPAPVQETAQQMESNNVIDLVEKYLGANFKVYPNPAQNVITIETVQDVAVTKVSLYSIDGKLILYTQPDSADGKYIMDISSVSKGIYVMSVETSNGRVTSAKVVKN